jgi:HD-GYP domain-containing protein (c-di-GMP phosphodiesterase class II)
VRTARVPQGAEWADVIEVLHTLTNVVTVRSHYDESHPAIARADDVAATGFARLLARIPEIVVALIDGELVVCERPMPDLRERVPLLAEAMHSHDVECIVFQRGVTTAECAMLGRTLAAQPADAARIREEARTILVHVLLRYAELRREKDFRGEEKDTHDFVPAVHDVLGAMADAIRGRTNVDRDAVREVAAQIVSAVAMRAFTLQQRCYVEGVADEAAHAVNVAMMTAAMALDAREPEKTCIEATAAALLHDIGHLFLPPGLRSTPEPLLDEQGKNVFRHHSFLGANALLSAGCPSLWVAAALEHHRGADGKGYPKLESKRPPQPIVRYIALANYMDRRRTLLKGAVDQPDEALRRAVSLQDFYFGRAAVERFVHALGVYPPGATVELSNREVAIVVEASPNDPLRPIVRVVTGEHAGKRMDLKALDAIEDRFVASIARPVLPPLAVLEVRASDAPVEEREGAAELILGDDGEPLPILEPLPQADEGQALQDVPVSLPPALGRTSGPPVARLSGMYSSVTRAPSGLQAAVRPSSRPPLPQRVSAPPVAPSTPPQADAEALEAEYLETIGSVYAVPRVVQRAADLAKLGLDHRAGFLLTFIDGESSVDMILDASGLPRLEVLRLVRDLVAKGVVSMG